MLQSKNLTPTRTSPSVALAKDGFTLIELLIAITIIVLLATMGLVAYRSAGENARNARREQDLAAIQAALEMYAFEVGEYPQSYSDLDEDYLNPAPQDPQGNPYSYNPVCNGTETICSATQACPSGCCAYELSAPDAEGGETMEICDTL